MILTGAQVRAGDASIGVVGFERVRGDLRPQVLDGRSPEGPDELALGRLTAHDLHVALGDRLTLSGPAGDQDYRIVGFAVVPTLADIDGVGTGAVASAAGLARVQPTPDTSAVAVNLQTGASRDVAEHFADSLGDRPPGRRANRPRSSTWRGCDASRGCSPVCWARSPCSPWSTR